MEEITYLNPIISNIKQYIFDKYTKYNSLLYTAKSDYHINFKNNIPESLYQYTIIFIVGHSKIENENIGMYPSNKFDATTCYFYYDYFKIHPSEIIYENCNNNFKCDIGEKKKWCNKCWGEISVHTLKKIIHEKINFAEMPISSIVNVEKKIIKIDYDNKDLIDLTYECLIRDKKKIDIIHNRIILAYEKLDKIKKELEYEINDNIEKLDSLLANKGGSLSEYDKLIKSFTSQN